MGKLLIKNPYEIILNKIKSSHNQINLKSKTNLPIRDSFLKVIQNTDEYKIRGNKEGIRELEIKAIEIWTEKYNSEEIDLTDSDIMGLLGKEYKFSKNKNGDLVLTHITQNMYDEEKNNIYLGIHGHPCSILGTTKDVILVNHFTTTNKEGLYILNKNIKLDGDYPEKNIKEFNKFIKENQELKYQYKYVNIDTRTNDTWFYGEYANDPLLPISERQYVSQVLISVPKADFNNHFLRPKKLFFEELSQENLIFVEDLNKKKDEVEVFQIKDGNYNKIPCKEIEFVNNSKNIDSEKGKKLCIFWKRKNK